MVNPKNNFIKGARVTGGFAYIYVFFTRVTQNDAKESCSRSGKSRTSLADKLDNIDQFAKAKKSLRAPDL